MRGAAARRVHRAGGELRDHRVLRLRHRVRASMGGLRCVHATCPHAATFPAFAEQTGQDGFGFLCQRLNAGRNDGPVLVTVEDDRIVGALGPLTTRQDRNGIRLQPPQYFAVHPAYRGRGHGRAGRISRSRV